MHFYLFLLNEQCEQAYSPGTARPHPEWEQEGSPERLNNPNSGDN